jgi:hypothetical protein
MVGTAGFEPTTSTVGRWQSKRNLLAEKQLLAGKTGKTRPNRRYLPQSHDTLSGHRLIRGGSAQLGFPSLYGIPSFRGNNCFGASKDLHGGRDRRKPFMEHLDDPGRRLSLRARHNPKPTVWLMRCFLRTTGMGLLDADPRTRRPVSSSRYGLIPLAYSLVERGPEKAGSGGSIPVPATILLNPLRK